MLEPAHAASKPGRSASDQSQGTNAEWSQRFRRAYPSCAVREHDPAGGVVFCRGQGAYLWDVEGNRWIDLTCGFSASNFGHSYPPLIDAAQRQLPKLTHVTSEPHQLGVTLAEELLKQFGIFGGQSKVMFNSSGARAVETALKAALTFRPGKIVCLCPGFHGRSVAAAVISDTPTSMLSQAISPLAVRWPLEQYPYCARCAWGLTFPECSTHCVERLVANLEQDAGQISCLVVEPALGARGYVFPPAAYFRKLRHATQELGILMIADEIQTGLGRGGDWLLSRRQGWEPDLVLLGKSLGGGLLPLAAVVGRSDVLDSMPLGLESETFAGNPLACAVGLAVLELLADGQLMQRGEMLGEVLRHTLQAEFSEQQLASQVLVEGQAASAAVEFVADEFRSDSGSRTEMLAKQQQSARRFARSCLDQRLRVHLSGPLRTRIVLLPPLTMQNDELQQTCDALSKAIHHFAQQPL